MATSTRSRYITILSAVALLFTMLTPLAAVAQEPADASWDFVTAVPGSEGDRFAKSVWTGERDVVYALTQTGSIPYDMQVQRFDHGTWHLELDLPGYYASALFGTGPADIYAAGYTCLQPDDTWTCPSAGADDVAVYHYNGVDWTLQSLPAEVGGLIVRSIAGVPGEVQLGINPYVLRDLGTGWEIVYDAGTGISVGPSEMTFVAPDEGYMASCWGHGRWDGVTWTKKVEFDFCDLADMWAARTDGGDLNLWVTGNNNFQNGILIWGYDEAAQSFGAKYSPEFSDPAPPDPAAQTVGTGTGLWGADADDVYATGIMWDPYPDYRSGRIYHFDGAGWTQLTAMGEIPGVIDVWGTATDDVWFSLDGGQLLHYGTTPEYAADWGIRTEAPHDIWSSGGSWDVGTEILVLVNDGQSGAEFAETVQVEQWGAEPTDVGWYVHTGDFVIEPGDLITVYDDSGSKNLTVVDLTVDDVDVANDTVSGTAPNDAVVEIYVSDGATDANVQVTADGAGAWEAQLAGTFDIGPGTWGSAAILDAEGDATEQNWHLQMPELNVTPDNDMVDGYYFELGATVTVEIDDPSNGVGVDWSGSDVAALPPWGADHSYVTLAPVDDGFDVVAGHIVTMSDGTTTKTLTVSPLAITDIDVDNDLVHGMATPDATIRVWVSDGQDPGREVVVAADGTWTVDYKLADGDSGPLDIGPGDAFDANEYDEDGDATHAYVGVPSPYFSVETPNQIWSHGDGWIAGRTVTITVNDGVGDVYTTTAPVEAWGPSPWEVGWNVDTGGFGILPGHIVTVDDGVDIVRTLDVVALEVTDVNEDTDTITGMAPANAWVNGNAGNEFENANRNVQADAGGNFSIDFGIPGVEHWEQDTIDLRPGVGGSVQVFEDDGDSTHRGWGVADPRFGVDVIHEEMWANDWPIGATLNFQVFEPDDLVNPVWDDSMTVVETPWGQTEAGYRFWGDFDVHGGQLITMTDGTTTKELAVSTLVVTNVDPDTETYTGTVEDVDYDKTHEVCAWARDLIDGQQGVELCTIPDGDRNWTIDFSGVGEIIPGDHTGAYQNDPDGDQTSYAWHVPPWIYVEIGDDTNPDFPDRVHLDQWDFPVEVTNGTDTITASDADNDGWEVVEFDVSPGETITATGNDGRVKSVYLEELSVDTVTLWNEDPASTVYGSTTITYEGNVQVTASADYGWWTERWVDASAGAYEADFANPGNGWREQELAYFGQGGADDVYSGGEIRSHIYDSDNDQVQAIWHATNPRIIIVRGNDRIEAIDFPKDEPLTIELDDPAFEGIEFSETGIPAANPDKPWETLLVFELGDYTVPDVATVTALDDTGTPIVETEVIPFSIDLVDPDNDTITGTAAEGSEVLVQADGNWRYPIADATDTWVADFSQPGTQPGEENPVDIGPGSSGGATLIAEGGSATTVLWSISNAAFSVDPDGDHVWGWEFAADASVTITIDGTEHGPFGTDGGGSFDAHFDAAAVDIVEGSMVVVTDGDTEKSHMVTALAITGVDEALDQVSGTAEAGTDVHVWVNETGANLDVTAADGTWIADFGGQADLGPGSNGGAQQGDDDGDSTHIGWLIFNPTVNVDPSGDGVWGEQWLPNDVVTIFVNDAEHSTLSTDDGGNFGEGWDPQGLDIVAGDKVEAVQGDVTKTHFVTTLAITGIDTDTEIMTGAADGPFDVWVHDTDAWRHLEHGGGAWSIDWSVPAYDEDGNGTADLEPGVNGNSVECDDDADCTWAGWNVANPHFRVQTPHSVDSAGSDGWVVGRTITMTIDDDADPGNGTLFSATESIVEDPEGPPQWGFSLEGIFEIEPGHVVTIDDGAAIVRSHVVELVTIDAVDEAAEHVLGTAEPLQWLHVNYDEYDEASDEWSNWNRDVQADTNGDWVADFGNPGPGPGEEDTADINQNGVISVEVFDDDGDYTAAGWESPPNPQFSVETPFSVWSHGEGWVEGRTVTLLVDDNDDPTDGILYNDSTVVERWGPEPWEVGWYFELEDIFEIEPGHFVSVYDGVEIEKTLWVEQIEITGIDEDADTIFGTAPQMARVEVNAGNEDYAAYRSVEADENGDWFADFASVGDEEHEQDLFDIEIDTGGAAQIFDDDGDSTHRGWYLEEPPNPNFFVRPDGDEIWGSEWYGGDEVTVTIYDAFGTLAHEATFLTEDGEFYESLDFNVVPLDYVVVTDGESTKDHVVTELTVTDVDVDADMVHGIATPGAEVFVGSSQSGEIWEHLNFQFGPDNRNPDSLNEHLRFRQAVAHAIDRDLLVAELPGAGDAIDSYVDAFLPELSQHGWSQYPYDPAAAAALIDELCTDVGRDCVTNPPVAIFSTTSDNDTREILADLLVPMFDAAGIQLQLELEPAELFFGDTFEFGTFDVGEWAWTGTPSLRSLADMHHWFDPEERYQENVYNWGTPDSSQINAETARMAELIGLMEATDDPVELEAYIAEAELILADQAMFVPLYLREAGSEIEGPYRVVTADPGGNWTADFSVPWEDQGVLDIVYGTGGYAEESDQDGDATHAGWQATASSATVEGHVYLDGAPLPDVEVWSSSDEVFTCTDSEGYFLFEDLSPVGDVLVATGPSYSDAGCGNTAFVDPDGMPLLVAGEGGLDLTDGYEYLEFNVEYAAAIQYVRVEDITGGSATPVNDVVIHAFDRNDEEFIAVFGHDPDPADYQAILDTGIGEIPWIDWTGAALDHEDGLAEVRYRYITDVLILAELDPVQGATSNADEFFENPDGIVEGPEIVFQIGEAGPIVTVDGVVMNEGDGATRILVTFRLTEPVDERVTVEWTTEDGSAVAGEDYLAAAGTVTFRPGRTEVWRRVQVLGDTDLEEDESFSIVLLSVEGAAAGEPGVITLLNDDEAAPPEPVLSLEDATVLEGDARRTPVGVTVTLSDPAPDWITFTVTTASGTADAGVDFVDVARTYRIGAGSTSATIYLRVLGDTLPEPNETFTVEVTDLAGALAGDTVAEVTILNDD